MYSLAGSKDSFRTPGGFWVMIPLYADDMGKEVRVALTPLYSNYLNETPDFLIGSTYAIYKTYFYQALPEMILSLSVALAGLFLLCFAVYGSIKRNTVFRLFAMSLMALATVVWRFTYGSFAYLLFENHTTAIYTLSSDSLLLISFAMLNCVELVEEKKGSKWIGFLSLGYCAVCIVQSLLQIAGILDLRQMLKFTHIMIVIGTFVLSLSSIRSCFFHHKRSENLIRYNYAWLLGIGAIVDLLLYYFSDSSVGMLFTLCAILCFSMVEGLQLLFTYTEQKCKRSFY